MAQPSRAELIARLQADVAETVSDGVALQEALADRWGLTISDLRAITLLMRKGTVSTSELADAAGLTSGAATRMVDRLERANWVERFRRAVHALSLPELHGFAVLEYGFFNMLSAGRLRTGR